MHMALIGLFLARLKIDTQSDIGPTPAFPKRIFLDISPQQDSDANMASNPQETMERAYEQYVRDFELTFHLSPDGELLCIPDTPNDVDTFVSNHGLTVQLITGVKMQPGNWKPVSDDPDAMAHNNLKLHMYYSVAFTTYLRFCQVLRRHARPEYQPVELSHVRGLPLAQWEQER
jgi:hypothetical protein